MPHLTFYCELPERDLLQLFEDATIIQHLQALDAAVSLGILDLSDGRAQVARRLIGAGIPVVAWLLLPTEQGYWFNINNVVQASDRYDDFKHWTEKHGLVWDGIGLDIEPDRREIEPIVEAPSRLPGYVLGKIFEGEKAAKGQAAYDRLVRHIREDGYRIDSYHIPLIVDERKAGSTLLRRVGGLVDVDADREVLMLYTSFFGTWMLAAYAPDAECIGVGSTGGGVDIADLQTRALSWDDLARDLRYAADFTNRIHIFSLEGCVARGYLEKLVDFDWSVPASLPPEDAPRARWSRRMIGAVLWMSAHPAVVIFVIGVLWNALKRRRK